MRKYYSLATNTEKKAAILNIFGDISSKPYFESDVSYKSLSSELAGMGDVERIDVFISSYGGEVGEGLAIYNALKRHPAQVTTYCDGFACSIASVIFMAGDKRVMGNPSRLMIHDAWTSVYGANADELRKQADDLDNVTAASVKAYMNRINIEEDKLREMMKAETWLTEEEALEMGFATDIDEVEQTDVVAQSAKKHLFAMLAKAMQADEDEDETEDNDEEAPETPEDAPEDEPEEEPAPDDETPGDGDSEDEEEEEEPEEKTAQMWSGFFNAIRR